MNHRGFTAVGVALLLYVFAMVAWVPLGPGLVEVMADEQGQTQVIAHGTHFASSPDQLRIFAGTQDRLFPLAFEVVNDHRLLLRPEWPDTLHKRSLDLYVQSPIDGTLSLGNAFFVENAVLVPAHRYASVDVLDGSNQLGFHFPFQPQIFETIRNLMLHVPMWFTMFFLMGISFAQSIRHLGAKTLGLADERAVTSAQTGLFFGIIGLVTGSLWARFTWGDWWVASDPQLNGALVTVLVYAGYLVLRAAVDDPVLRARISAVFNLFAFVLLIILLMIFPRFNESLHPGKGGNPGFNTYDLDSSLRAVFYPAVIGWILLGMGMYRLRLRMESLSRRINRMEP